MRQYPRIEIDSLAAVRIEDGTIVQARIRDISPDGLRVLVTREDALVIHPGAKAIAPDSDRRVMVALQLPVIGGNARVTAICRLTHFGLNPDRSVAIGLQFKEFRKDGAAQLYRFVRDSLLPAEFAA